MTLVITNVTIGSIVNVEVCEVVLIQDCPINCNINLKDKLIKNSKTILNNDGNKKFIKAVITVKINILF